MSNSEKKSQNETNFGTSSKVFAKSSDAQVSLYLLTEGIVNDNVKEVETQLRRIQLFRLPVESSDTLLATLLNLAANFNRGDLARMVIKNWQNDNFEEERGSNAVLTRLFQNEKLEDQSLRFVTNLYPDRTFIEYAVDLLDSDSSPEILGAMKRVFLIFGEQPRNVYRILLDYTYDQHADEGAPNWILQEFLKEKVNETAPFREKPAWVKTFPDLVSMLPSKTTETKGSIETKPGKLPTNKELMQLADQISQKESETFFQLPDASTASSLLTEGMQLRGATLGEVEETKKIIENDYNSTSKKDKFSALQPVIETKTKTDLGNDSILYRILGPVNVLLASDFNGDTICDRYGGCRMMTCYEFDKGGYQLEDEDQVNDFEPVEWFQGFCEFCHYRIREKHYAIRRPLAYGGFQGAYCSFDCLYADIPNASELDTNIIEQFREKLMRTGIQDRTWP